jgi:exodeoxyribonuclease VII small subunit
VPADLPFEAGLERLEAIVQALDRGDLALEAALAAFEEGVELARHCHGCLAQAEQRIELLMRDGESLRARPFVAGEPEPGQGD